MQPLVSIIIPLYNAENFIAETIESALNQSYKNIELIIIDDGSTDSSYSVASKYKNPNIKLIQQTNKGASAARNSGLRVSKGEYIQYLDADDIIHANKIEDQLNTLNNYPEKYLIGCQWRYFVSDINTTFQTMPFHIDKLTCFDKTEWLMNRYYMIPHTWLISRKLIKLSGDWNEKLTLNDDGEYFYRLIAQSEGIIMDNNVLAFYRAGNPYSLSTQRTKKAMISWFNSIKSYKKIMYELAGNKANNYVDKALYELSYHCINLYPEIINMCKDEMYQPNVLHNIGDSFVYNLSKIIGISKAKQTRVILKIFRESKVVDYIFFNIKRFIKHKNI